MSTNIEAQSARPETFEATARDRLRHLAFGLVWSRRKLSATRATVVIVRLLTQILLRKIEGKWWRLTVEKDANNPAFNGRKMFRAPNLNQNTCHE